MVTPSSSIPVVIDTDPGIDDLVALALAARAPELDLVAVTTTYGNASLADTTCNARHVLRLAGRSDVPVLPGADRALLRPLAVGRASHGPHGRGYANGRLDRSTGARLADPEALLQALTARPPNRATALVTLGPLTNLAHALHRDAPAVRERVRRHVAMAGALDERGAAGRAADFNAWADPEALHTVLAAGLPTMLVPLDVTRQLRIPAHTLDAWRRASDPLVTWLTDALRFAVEVHRARSGFAGCHVHDVLAVGALVDARVLDFTERRLKIALSDDADRGKTRVDPGGYPVRVARRVAIPAAHRLLDRVFGPEGNEGAGGAG
ncbi:MAG: nucleoside hydrolase [Gemmatimonadota bacterium]|nr:nucleoside hydrolase [Gemmatimonadota bacterium]